jgi:hypothetical protein
MGATSAFCEPYINARKGSKIIKLNMEMLEI